MDSIQTWFNGNPITVSSVDDLYSLSRDEAIKVQYTLSGLRKAIEKANMPFLFKEIEIALNDLLENKFKGTFAKFSPTKTIKISEIGIGQTLEL